MKIIVKMKEIAEAFRVDYKRPEINKGWIG